LTVDPRYKRERGRQMDCGGVDISKHVTMGRFKQKFKSAWGTPCIVELVIH